MSGARPCESFIVKKSSSGMNIDCLSKDLSCVRITLVPLRSISTYRSSSRTENGQEAFTGLLAQVATKVHVEVVGCEVRELNLNTEFVTHPKHSTCKHPCKVPALALEGTSPSPSMWHKACKVVGNGVRCWRAVR